MILGIFFVFAIVFYSVCYFIIWSPKARQRATEQKQRDLEAKLKVKELKHESELRIKNAQLQADISMRVCPYCGTQHKSDAQNCPSCGALIR